jgi:hypothetical protein
MQTAVCSVAGAEAAAFFSFLGAAVCEQPPKSVATVRISATRKKDDVARSFITV